jgi:hypothetical protein
MTRIGLGYDIHRLEPGRKLVLGGETIPFEKGLSGHSDADVLVHAACDALLGAAGMGDIGDHFPDTDPRYRDVYSIELLTSVYRRVQKGGLCAGQHGCHRFRPGAAIVALQITDGHADGRQHVGGSPDHQYQSHHYRRPRGHRQGRWHRRHVRGPAAIHHAVVR